MKNTFTLPEQHAKMSLSKFSIITVELWGEIAWVTE